jgi:urease accessory protein UreF
MHSPSEEESLWLALLLCDSSFPSGSFSHSLGLESALHHGYIKKDEVSLKQHLHLIFEQV